jgi:endonuclease G
MYKYSHFLCSLFTASLLLASCVVEEVIWIDPDYYKPVPVKFQAGIGLETKVSGMGGDEWEATDTIGVYMIRAGSTLVDSAILEDSRNKPYIVANGAGSSTATFVTAGDTVYYPNGEEVNFVAYDPYAADKVSADFNYLMDVSVQTEPARLDLLYSNDQVAYSSKNHNAHLSFEHLMTRLVFDAILTGNSQASLAGLQLEVQGVNTSTTFDLSTGLPASDGAGQNNISPSTHFVSTDSVRMEATLLPMADASGIHLHFELDDKTYNSSLPSTSTGRALLKGKRYTYRVVFDQTGITLEGQLSPWDEEPGDTIIPKPQP